MFLDHRWESGAFWIEKVRNICEIVHSMRDHGGFAIIIKEWRRAEKDECIAELDRLICALSEWKRDLVGQFDGEVERDFAVLRQSVAELRSVRPAPTRLAHLRAARSSGPARLMPLRIGERP